MEQFPGEQKEAGPIRNLCTAPRQTIEAMATLEGPAWVADQFPESPEGNQQSLPSALEKLRAGKAHGRIIINGATVGARRWIVEGDGTVKFSESHANEEDVQRARELGFEITS